MSKDLFSKQAQLYSQYRPSYPNELFDYILTFVQQKEAVWDCATGNGQAAGMLAHYFKEVIATDISVAQIANAVQKENIQYLVCPAEETPFEENTFDLITVAQAYHWLNWKRFHQEAFRVAKNEAVVAIWNYNLLNTDRPQVSQLINYFYSNIIANYWEPERKYVDNNYATALFEFDPLPSRQFSIHMNWRKEELTGYLNTWSAVQKYRQVNNSSPLLLIKDQLDTLLNEDEILAVEFPVHLRLGRIIK